MSVFCFGLSHQTAAVDVRERFAIPESALPEASARAEEDARAYRIRANLLCYDIFGRRFSGPLKIPKGRAPATANRPSPLPDSIQAPPRVGFDGE